jgi:hypothetical protein
VIPTANHNSKNVVFDYAPKLFCRARRGPSSCVDFECARRKKIARPKKDGLYKTGIVEASLSRRFSDRDGDLFFSSSE